MERFELPREEALALMEEKQEPYKVELIRDLPEGEIISFYRQGEITDLCAGPHLMNTKDVGKAYKLTSIAGAYWRGDEHNKMLTRIYATAFGKKEELEAYLTMMEEAKKRDHRKLGRELGLFMMHEAGPGFPFFLPKGMVLKNTLLDYWREIHQKSRLRGDFHAHYLEPQPVGDLRPLGSLQKQHVHHGDRRAGLRH